jgi:hypothetical protein
MSPDGKQMLVAARGEPADPVYKFERYGNTITQVGIITAYSPDYTFNMGTPFDKHLAMSADAKSILIGYEDTSVGGAAGGAAVVYDQVNQTSLMSDSSGNIGIGTDNPEYKTTIAAGSGNAKLNLKRSNVAANGNAFGSIFYTNMDGTDVASIRAHRESANDDAYLAFATRNTGGSITEQLRIHSGGQITKSNQPAFYAYGNTGNTHVSGSDVIYPTAGINVGGHYNTGNGLFTAPVAGIYHFAWSSIGNTTDDVYRFYIRVNGSNIYTDFHLRQDTTETGSAYADNANKTVLVNLNANDNVRIHYSSGGATFYPGTNDANNYYVSFSGYLLQ